jgi:MFS family permease
MTEPDSPSSRGFFLVACALLIAMIGTTLPTPLYVYYQQQMGFGETWVTLIFAIYALGVIAALLAVGSWSDQIGRRPMLFAGLLMGVVSAVIFLFCDSIGGLLLGRLFSGFSAGIMTGTATVAVIELAPKAWSKRATLIATAANMFGLGLGPLLAGLTSQYLPQPLQLVFWLHLGCLAVAMLGIVLARETVERPPVPRLRVMRPSIPPQVRALFIPAAIAGMAGFSVAGLFTSMVPSIMRQIMGQSDGVVIGAVVGSFFAASVLGQAALQWLPSRSHMTTGCAGLILGMVTLGLSISTQQLNLLMIAGALAGIGQGMVFRAGMGAVTAASPAHQKAAVSSALFVVFYFSMSLPVIAVGVSVPAYGLRHVGELFSAIVAVVAVLAMFSMKRAQAITTVLQDRH